MKDINEELATELCIQAVPGVRGMSPHMEWEHILARCWFVGLTVSIPAASTEQLLLMLAAD